MPLIPQQGREARGGIKPREAQPIHCAGAPNKRGGLQIADQAIVLKEHHLPAHQIDASVRPYEGARERTKTASMDLDQKCSQR